MRLATNAVFGIVLWLVFRDEDSARRFGRRGDRIVNWLLRFFHRSESDRVERAVMSFRDQSVDVMRERGWLLTAADEPLGISGASWRGSRRVR